jgi:hypothetical protein
MTVVDTGKLTGDKLNGKLKDSAGEESTFNLSKIKTKSGMQLEWVFSTACLQKSRNYHCRSNSS